MKVSHPVYEHIMNLSMQHSHPYIEKYYSKKWVTDFKVGYLPRGVFPYKDYNLKELEDLGVYYESSGYSPFEGRVIIPVFDGSTLVTLAGRYPNKVVPHGVKKYINGIFDKDNHFFTKPMIGVQRDRTKGLILCEGYTDVFALDEFCSSDDYWKDYVPAGLMGLSFSQTRINRVNALGLPVIFMLDGDTAGSRALFQLRDALMNGLTVPIKVIYDSLGFDPEEYIDFFGTLAEPMSYGMWVVTYMTKNNFPPKDIVETCMRYGFDEDLKKYLNAR